MSVKTYASEDARTHLAAFLAALNVRPIRGGSIQVHFDASGAPSAYRVEYDRQITYGTAPMRPSDG